MSERVHELAKELKITSKALISELKKLKITAKSHMSVLTEAEVRSAKTALKKTAPAAKPAPTLSQTPSLESVKKEFLLQRLARPSAPEVKRQAAQVQPRPKRIPDARPPEKPKAASLSATPVEEKKITKPAAAPIPAAAVAAPEVKPQQPVPAEPLRTKKLQVRAPITVKDLAALVAAKPSDLIQRLIRANIFATMNQSINFDAAKKVVLEYGYEAEEPKAVEAEEATPQKTVDASRLKPRAPIVTFMGHVDHGKTSLLDAIRKTKVAAKEAGGITQHIGAYEVFLPKGAVTFLDTPGHEAFTAMRARGARATDVVVLVVAADDGVMPQTIEAIDHAKAAGVPIIVAINKIDLPAANPDRVKKGLMEHELMPEEWGGKTVMVPVSAKTGKGIDDLLDFLALESELLELRADPTASATGVVIEAELSKESGVLATVLVENGTLRAGDVVIVGPHFCKVRAMIDDRGQRIKEAPPSMPVEILGLPGVPRAGDRFEVVKDERQAKELLEKRADQSKEGQSRTHVTLEHLFEEVQAGKVEGLKLILKADVQGSIEALRSTLGKIQSKNVRLNIIHAGIGDVSESDVMLAAASNAVVIGFHTGIVSSASEIAEREGVDVRFYEIIYEVKTAIEKAMEGLLEPELKEVFVGQAEVRQVFKVSKAGTIAGCSVQKGKIVRNFPCRVLRAGQKVHEGKIESLKRFKDDAREVLEGFECGIGVSNFSEIMAGDRIEVYEIQKKARKLE
ncbi:MAG: translation initiation factor IF-2 [Candidatus Omnitrophica bacterium]|nr:translation initiation factor IF-2 [Candidatus Omnitrophota bacterium]